MGGGRPGLLHVLGGVPWLVLIQRGLACVFRRREGLQVSVGEASHARGRALLVGFDGVEVIIIRGWLGEQSL